jgi:RimJ/RimL family protein N-acetyltransferase
METLETDRLLLRPMTMDDLPFFTTLHADSEVVRFLGSGQPRPQQETREWLERTLRWYAADNLGYHAIVRKSDKALIGRGGLTCYEIELSKDGNEPLTHWGKGSTPYHVAVIPEVDLSCTLTRAAWGQGYATEAMRLMRDHAFRQRGFERLIALLHPDNTVGHHLAGKLGFRKQPERVTVSRRSFLRFGMTREEWKALAPS